MVLQNYHGPSILIQYPTRVSSTVISVGLDPCSTYVHKDYGPIRLQYTALQNDCACRELAREKLGMTDVNAKNGGIF